MADEPIYSSESNKRKYEDSPSLNSELELAKKKAKEIALRLLGRLARARVDDRQEIDSNDHYAPPSNNYVPDSELVELARKKAREIASRLLGREDPLTRARVDNRGVIDSSDCAGKPKHVSKKIEVPNSLIIGEGVNMIKFFQLTSGAKINKVTRDNPNSSSRVEFELMGTPHQITQAELLFIDVLCKPRAGGSERSVLKVSEGTVARLLAEEGKIIKHLEARTGVRIQVLPPHLQPGDISKERTVQIDGTSEEIEIETATHLVEEVNSDNPAGNPNMSGKYSQQGYPAGPPHNWGLPIQPQPSYGYNMNHQPNWYPNPLGVYTNAPGWGPPTAPPNQPYGYYNEHHLQQGQGGGGYNPLSDGIAYNGGQVPPAYSEIQSSYKQDVYGRRSSYQAQPGYIHQQQQQGYNSNYTNQAPPSGQTYQPFWNPNYPPQGGCWTQMPDASYGAPQTQQPAGGQPSRAPPHGMQHTAL